MKGNAAYSMPGRRQKLSLLYDLEKNAADATNTRIGGAATGMRLERAPAVPTPTAIPTAATEQQNEKDNYQDRFHGCLHRFGKDNAVVGTGVPWKGSWLQSLSDPWFTSSNFWMAVTNVSDSSVHLFPRRQVAPRAGEPEPPRHRQTSPICSSRSWPTGQRVKMLEDGRTR